MARAGLIGVVMVITLTGSSVGSAQTKKARVRTHKTRAFDHFEKGEYAAGIGEMEKAYALIPHPGFLLNIAVAYDRWPGHCAESLETFDRFFMECDNCKLLAGAKKQHAEVEATCRVPVSIRSTPEGARVAVDGAFRGKTPFSTRLLPGRYAIVVDLSGHARAMRDLTIERGQPQSVEVELVPRAAPPPPPPPPPIAVVTEEPTTGPSPITWVAFGVGAAGVVMGASFTALAVNDLDREEEARNTPLPKAEIEAIQDEARRDAILAYVGYGIGVAGVATGVILLLVTPKDEPSMTAAIGPRSVGLAGRF